MALCQSLTFGLPFYDKAWRSEREAARCPGKSSPEILSLAAQGDPRDAQLWVLHLRFNKKCFLHFLTVLLNLLHFNKTHQRHQKAITTPTTNPTRVKGVSLGTKQNLHQDIAKGTLTVAAAGRTPCRSAIAKASQC